MVQKNHELKSSHIIFFIVGPTWYWTQDLPIRSLTHYWLNYEGQKISGKNTFVLKPSILFYLRFINRGFFPRNLCFYSESPILMQEWQKWGEISASILKVQSWCKSEQKWGKYLLLFWKSNHDNLPACGQQIAKITYMAEAYTFPYFCLVSASRLDFQNRITYFPPLLPLLHQDWTFRIEVDISPTFFHSCIKIGLSE